MSKLSERRARLTALRGRQETYEEIFRNDGEMLLAVAEVSDRGYGSADRRLEFSAAATGASGGVPAEGGFLVPDNAARDWWERTYAVGRILGNATHIPVTNDKISIPAIDENSRADGSRTGGVAMAWVNEGGTTTASKPKFRKLTLLPKKIMGLAYATNELLADEAALGALLPSAFAQEAAFIIEDQIINGSGAGRPLGVLNSNAVITVSKESGQSAATLGAANLQKMMARCWGPSRPNSLWLMNNDCLAQVEDASFSNGKPVVTYDANGNPRILGRPVVLDEYTAALGTVGDVILADFSQYLIGEKEPGVASSIHVRFLNDEKAFRFRFRIDGQPAWASPVTPKNSSTTQSPFVTLETR